MSSSEIIIRPQKGPQEAFLKSSADIVIYGGAAGGGKTYGLLMEPLRHMGNPGFGAVLFRESFKAITVEGGIWDTAMGFYPQIGATPRGCSEFTFPSGAAVSFDYLAHDKDVFKFKSSQIALLLFDELTHFSEYQFFYMLSRNRSTCGVKPYVRATTNPDADSWVARFIAWWIDKETGLPIPERDGVVRWFVRLGDAIHWGDSPDELAGATGCEPTDPKSVTFIAAKLTDNKILMEKDPGYMANLKALTRVERERLLGGNWKIKATAGMYFNRAEVTILPVRPTDVTVWVRAWDFAATERNEENPDPDATAGILLGLRQVSGGNMVGGEWVPPTFRYVIADLVHARLRAAKVRNLVKTTADLDGRSVRISVPEDPGQAGKEQAQSYVSMLPGHVVKRRRRSTDKEAMAEPFAAQWQAGNVEIVRGPWNDLLFSELESFPSPSVHDDIVDACSDAYAELTGFSSKPAAGGGFNKR
jgi:predicted phage terminase large subunit-like protein